MSSHLLSSSSTPPFFFSTSDHGPKHSRAVAEIVPADTPGAKAPKGRAFPKVYLTSREPLPQGLSDPHQKKSAASTTTAAKKKKSSGGARSEILGAPSSHAPPPDGMRSALSASGVSNFTLDDPDLKLAPMFFCQQDGKSSRYYIGGASLSGKSYYASLLAKSYAQQFPRNRIIIFSVDHDDPSYASLHKFCEVIRFPLDKPELILENPIELRELQGDADGALVIFDDHVTSDKAVNKALMKLKDDCLCRGRHFGLSTIVARQVLLAGHETKTDLTNSLACVLFPNSSGRKSYLDFLAKYVGLKQAEITRINRETASSRWVCVTRAAPLTIMHERGIFLINDFLNDD